MDFINLSDHLILAINKQMPERVVFYIGDTPIPSIQNISTPYRKNANKHYMAINQWPLYYGISVKWY